MSTSTNPFTYGKPITLDTLGDLLSHHRSNLGGWRMGPDPEPTPTPPTPTPAPAPAPEPPAFQPITSQDDLDKVLGQRLAREREKYGDYDDLKKKAEQFDAAAEAAKTEAEKAIDAARKEGETSGRSAGHALLVKAEARATAAELKFRNPALAVATVDLSGVKVNEDGTVDAEAIKAKLTALATSDPYLVDDGKKPGPKADRSQGGGSGTGGEKPGSIAEARERARAEREKKHPKTA